MAVSSYPGRLAVLQRVLPAYRAPFFEALARACRDGLDVCAGYPRPQESIASIAGLRGDARLTWVRNIHLFQGPLYLCHQRGLPAWLEATRPDALIVEANPRYLSTPAAVHWMKARRKPVLGWGLGAPSAPGSHNSLQEWARAQRRSMRYSFLRQFDALLTYSHRGAAEYAALGFPPGKIFVAPNAAAPRPAHPLPSRPAGFAGQPNVLFVGRLQARKRVNLLIQACAALPAALQPHLVIVGDGPERASLESLAQTVFPSTEFAGARHGPELASYFTAADLFVLPGTGGLAVQEAMSYGLPVIMGQGDGTNDDLVRSANGWQILADDLPALQAALQTAISDVDRLRVMGAESYRIVAEEINVENMVAVFLEALRSVC